MYKRLIGPSIFFGEGHKGSANKPIRIGIGQIIFAFMKYKVRKMETY